MREVLIRLIADETGVAATEYALLAALVGLGLVLTLTQVGDALIALFDPVEKEVAKCVSVGSNCRK